MHRTADMVVRLVHPNISVRILTPFRDDEAAAHLHALKHPAGEIMTCFYRGDDITFAKTSHHWKWVVWAVFGVVPSLVCLMYAMRSREGLQMP